MNVITTVDNVALQKSPGTRQFVIFGQDKNLFALEIATVREVLVLSEQPISPVPNTLPFLLGLTNLRGEILALADFGRFIGGADAVERHKPESRILVVEAPDPRDVKLPPIRMGLAVSFVDGVKYLNLDEIASASEVGEDLAPYLRGLYDCEGRLLMIVDVEAMAQSSRW